MSMAVNTLLIELGVEELPPGALAKLAFALRDGIVKALNVSADDLTKIEEKLAQESAVAAAQDSDSDSE